MFVNRDTTFEGKELLDIDAEGCNIVVSKCSIHRLYALNCVVTVTACTGHNVGQNFVQLDKCRNCLVEWCQIINENGKTNVEDNISLYKSADCIVRNNWIEGATPSSNYSGSGIMVDKGCIRCQVRANVIVNTQNAGIGVAGGSTNLVRDNRVISTGPGVNGNVGIYIANQYKTDPFVGNVGMSNGVCWLTSKGRNDWWTPDAARWVRNFQIAKAERDVEYAAWTRRKR